MKLLSFISDHLLLFVFLSLLWGTTIATTRTTQAETTTTQKTTTKLLASKTQNNTPLMPTMTKSALENVQNVTVKTRNETSITLQWKKVSSTDTYVLEFNQKNITITAINASAELMTYTVLDLTDGTRYKFSLFTVSGNVTSSGVNHSAVTAPRSVNVTVVSQNEMSITLKWDKVNNISTYILQYIHNGNDTEINIIVSQEGPAQYVASPLTSGTSYSFTLFSVFEGVRSSGYRFSAVTAPENIQNVSVKAQNERSITLKWDKVNNISTYILQYIHNGNDTEKNINVSQEGPAQYMASPLTSGTSYSFTLFSVFEGVRSSGYRFSAVTVPENIQNVSVKAQNERSITLKWDKVNNISAYILQYIRNGNATEKNISVSQEGPAQYVASPLTSATSYSFTLFSVFEGVRSSGYRFSAVTAPENIQNVSVKAQNERSITLKWDKVNNISTYILQYNYNGSTTEMNISVSQEGPIKHVASPPTSATSYSFTLFSVFEGVRSSGFRFSAVTVPENIQNVSVKAQNETSITLKWDKVNNISTYILQYNYNGSATEMNISVSQEGPIEYVVSPLSAGTSYSFTLFTVLEGVSSSGYRFSAVTAPENVQNVTLVAQTNSSITLSWSKINSISDYILKYDKEDIISETQNDPIVHVVTPLTAGTKYNFTLFTMFGGVKSSGYRFNAVTAPCDAVEFRSLYQNETSITLQWKKVSNTDTYVLEFNQRNITITASSELMTYTVLDLTDGTRYKFSLFAVFENIRSSGVNHIAVTAPRSVKDVTVVSQNETSITLMWDKVNNISAYVLQYNYSGSATEMNISVSQEGPAQYVVSPLDAGTNYSFTLLSVFEGVRSTGYTFTAVTAPLNIKNLKTLDQNETSITLQWEKVPNVDMYTLVFNEKEFNTASAEVVTYSVGNLTSGSRYNFSLFTVFGNVRSSGVSHLAVTVPPMVSSVSVTKRFTNNITLEWEKMNEAWEYLLQISGRVSDSSAGSSNIKVVTALNPGTEYNFTLTTMFSGLNSTAYRNFTVTAIDCASADWTVTNSSIKGKIEGLFSHANASNGSQKSVCSEGKNVSFTDLYPGATYEISLVYEKSSRRFLQCRHKITVLPPNLKAHCEYWAAGYSVLIAWNEPDGEWTAVEVNVSETSLTKNRSEKEVVLSGFQPAKKYQVSVTSLSGPDGTVRSSEPHVFNCETDPRGVIAGSIFAVLLFCLLVALVVFIFLKRPHIISRKKSFISGSKVSNTRSVAISAAKFPDHFHQLSLDDNRGFSEEYEDLAPVGTEQARKIAILPENKAKNRFSNVLPYDWCRVKLRTQDHSGTSDYINANYMPGYRSTREYIATQGPLPSTVNDFWRMIWEQKVKRIIMVTNCIEGGRTKCEQYWPADRKPSLHGDLQVTIRSEQPEPNWTLREFSLKDRKTSEERRVKHFHFTAWPDHGVPQGTQVLIQFRGLVRQHIEREGSNAPTVIHCSAGVGRTGTIIALDVLLQQLQKEQAVGINAFVHKMRLNRPYMVQTESQYIFLHQCVMDSLQPKETNEENVYENADMIYVNATALHELRRHNANA